MKSSFILCAITLAVFWPSLLFAQVQTGLLVTRVDAVYPVIAKAAHVSGAVILNAVITRNGDVRDVTVVSGPPLLQDAAITAVRQWKYKPYLLKGKPTEVETSVIVNFGFASNLGDPSIADAAIATQRTAAEAARAVRDEALAQQAAEQTALMAQRDALVAQRDAAAQRTAALHLSEIDAIQHPDTQAMRVKLAGARFQKLPNKGDAKHCNKEGSPYQKGDCSWVADQLRHELGASSPLVETAYLKLCSLPSVQGYFAGESCGALALLYEARNELGLAVAAAENCVTDNYNETLVCLEVKERAYDKFDLRTEEKRNLARLCRGANGIRGGGNALGGPEGFDAVRMEAQYDPCARLRAIDGEVDIQALYAANLRDGQKVDTDYAESVRLGQEASARHAAEAEQHQARVNAITSAIAGLTYPNPAPASPPYSPRPVTSPTTGPQQAASSVPFCRDMTSCMKVMANYDRDKFLNVNVTNACGEQISATVSVYADGRSCTKGQTSNLNPGQTMNLGALTPRNWYSAQADNDTDSGRIDRGCKLVIPTACGN